MKIQLDTTNKTIKVEGKVNLGELLDTLDKLLPNGLFKEFDIDCNTVIYYWDTYKVIPYYPYGTTPYTPWITWTTSTSPTTINCTNSNYKLNDGVYNITCQ